MDITGRDRHLITRALAIAIATIDRADPVHQPASDRDDMKRLLEGLVPSDEELAQISGSVVWLFSGIDGH